MQKIRVCLRWLTAAATLALLVVLCWQCIDIYLVGNSPANLDAQGVHLNPVYSRETVDARIKDLLPLLAGYVLLVLCALAAEAGSQTAAPRAALSPENRLRLMKARAAELPEAALAEERCRRRLRIAAGMALLACAAGACAYLLDGANFTSWDLEMVMGQLLLYTGPWAAAAFAVMIGASWACGRSMEREIAALKAVPKSAPAQRSQRVFPLGIVRMVIFVVAAAFIVLGVMNGGLYDVLVKAINICTECIGLG